jgi:hypothetical protein
MSADVPWGAHPPAAALDVASQVRDPYVCNPRPVPGIMPPLPIPEPAKAATIPWRSWC